MVLGQTTHLDFTFIFALRWPAVAGYHEIMELTGIDLDHARQNTLEAFMSRLRRKLVGSDRSELTLNNRLTQVMH